MRKTDRHIAKRQISQKLHVSGVFDYTWIVEWAEDDFGQ